MDRSAYWSVVAQVAPVIALALVLEVRGFARRSARDSPDAASGRARGWFAALALVSASCLLIVFLNAVWALARHEDPPVSDLFVFVSLSIAFSFVAFNPITPIVGVLAADVYSRGSEAARTAFGGYATRLLDQQIDRLERGARDERLAALITYADHLVRSYAALRRAKAQLNAKGESMAEAYIDRLEAWRVERDEFEEEQNQKRQAEIARIRGMIAEMSASRQNAERIREALEALGN